MRLDAGSVLLLSGLVAWVTAPRDRREGVDIRAMQLGPFFPVGTNGLCPSQCLMDDDVLLCHHADGLSMLQLASCVKFNPRSFTVVELRSTVDICTCFLLDFVRLTANQEIITFTPKSCGQALLTLCNHMLPNRGKKLEHQGVAAGLVMEQSEAGWRKATRRHLAWLWNKISAIKSTASRNRYRALVIKTIKSVYWSDSGLKTGVKDRIVPFMLFKDGHLGPLYGGGRKGWYDAKDFKPAMEAAIAGSDWVHLHSFQTLVKEKIEYKEEQQGKIYVVSEESTPGPSQQGKKKETASVAFKPYLPENGILQRKTWFNKKRIAVIVFILCVVVGIVIMSCMYALLHSGGQFKRKKKSKGTKKNMFRRLSSMAGWDTEDEGDKNEPGEDRKESYGDRRPSQKPEPEEIKRRLSMPYSQWSPDDFELARELDEEKKDQAKRRTGSGQAEEEDARADLVGTFKIRGSDTCHRVLDSALAAGYRSFDTASVYCNEEDIGKSLQTLLPKHGLCRQDIFITSKLAPKDQGRGACREACLQSLARLQCDYLDLFLIHWPGTQKLQPDDSRHKPNRLGSWVDMEQLFNEGKLRAIGVSNFLQRHLEELTAVCTVKPAVLQIEFHPHLVQKNLRAWCRQKDIHFQAYSSLGTSSEDNKLLTDPTVQTIAGRYSKTPAQVLLRWAVQQDIGVLPKSTNEKHIQENAAVFDFTLQDDDMQVLSDLNSDVHYCWDSSHVT